MTLDTSQLPSDVQAMIAKAVADALAANQPAPPRELTPAEQAANGLKQLEAALRADHSAPSPVHNEFYAVSYTLGVLIDAVFPKSTMAPPAPAPADSEVS